MMYQVQHPLRRRPASGRRAWLRARHPAPTAPRYAGSEELPDWAAERIWWPRHDLSRSAAELRGRPIREIPRLADVDHQQMISTARCNNIVGQSHRPTRRQERQQQGFKRRKPAQEFLRLHPVSRTSTTMPVPAFPPSLEEKISKPLSRRGHPCPPQTVRQVKATQPNPTASPSSQNPINIRTPRTRPSCLRPGRGVRRRVSWQPATRSGWSD